MGQKPTKAIVAGVAGAIGVVATAQSPVAQSAVNQLTQLTTDTQHVQKVANEKSVTTTKSTQTADNQGIIKKSDVIRAHQVAAAKDLTLVTDDQVNNVPAASAEKQNSAQPVQAVYQVNTPAPEKLTATPAQQAVLSEADLTTSKAADTFTYTIKDGDTLGQLAAEYGTTVEALRAVNPDVNVTMLQVGQQIETPKQFTDPDTTVANTVDQVNNVTEADSAPVVSQVDALAAVASVDETAVASTAAMAKVVTPTVETDDTTTGVATASLTAAAAPVSDATPVTEVASSAAAAAPVSDATPVTEVASSAAAAVPVSDATPVTEVASSAATEAPVSEAAPVTNVASSAAPTANPVTSVATSLADSAAAEPTTAPTNVTAPTSTLTSAQRSAIVSAAVNFAGQDIPYVWGGKTPAGFDCSGLAAWVYQEAGVSLPSYTIAEEAYVGTTDVHTKAEAMATAQPGDLLFWGGHGSTWHVAIYIGGGQYVAAPEPGMNVHIETIDETNFMPDFVGSYNV